MSTSKLWTTRSAGPLQSRKRRAFLNMPSSKQGVHGRVLHVTAPVHPSIRPADESGARELRRRPVNATPLTAAHAAHLVNDVSALLGAQGSIPLRHIGRHPAAEQQVRCGECVRWGA